jgi:hypothetical protein
MYKLLIDPLTNELNNIIWRTADNTFIPMVEGNTDYQQYLKWVEEGNTPLPADEGAA